MVSITACHTNLVCWLSLSVGKQQEGGRVLGMLLKGNLKVVPVPISFPYSDLKVLIRRRIENFGGGGIAACTAHGGFARRTLNAFLMHCFISCICQTILLKGAAGVAQWREHSPPTNVARVRFPDSASYVG